MDMTLVTLEVRTLHGEQLGGRVRCACGWSHGEYGGTTSWVLADLVRLVAEHPHPLDQGGALEGGAPPAVGTRPCSHGYHRAPGGWHIETLGACTDLDQNRADRPRNRAESAENRGEMIDGAE